MSHTVRNLIVAALLALVGIVLVVNYINSETARLQQGQKLVEVVVAKKTIPAGTKAELLESGGYIETKEVIRDNMAPSALTLEDFDKENDKNMLDLTVRTTVFEGEQVTARKLADESTVDAAATIAGTERLMSLPLGSTQGVAGLIEPGDRIDIYGSVKASDAAIGAVTWLAARDVLVVHTPRSLERATTDGEAGAPGSAPTVDDDFGVFVVQLSDKSAREVIHTYLMSDKEVRLWVTLRPDEGAENQKNKNPLLGPPKVA